MTELKINRYGTRRVNYLIAAVQKRYIQINLIR